MGSPERTKAFGGSQSSPAAALSRLTGLSCHADEAVAPGAWCSACCRFLASDGGGKNEHKISALVVFASIIQCFSFREDAAQRCCGVASAAHLHGSPVLILLHLLCSRWVFLHQLHMAESTPVLHLSEAKVAVTQVKRVRAELKLLDVKTLVHVREEFPQSCVDL